MESIAPTALAQSWDNVGLLAGDPQAAVSTVLACIDLTPGVLEEAVRKHVEFILAYHPPLFQPVSSLRADSTGTESVMFQCIRNGIAVYAVHTALDAADGGTNDVLASLCGIKETEPIEYVDEPHVEECKLVVFVPADNLDKVADAMFAAGAGKIGDYSRCSYRSPGQGTFFGGDTTNPAIGARGRMECVDEIRLETVVPRRLLPAVVGALVNAHPYDEPAFDIYPLRPRPVRGIGRVGRLSRAITLGGLARKLKRATKADGVQIVGRANQLVERAIILAGAAGSMVFQAVRTSARTKARGSDGDVIVTGEIRHHDALTIRRLGCTAVALGHWASERPVLASLVTRLQDGVPGIAATVSTKDRAPFEAA
jgi:dinuclear metal center YbgI/SA1388 family protein